ncbi:MAG: pyridoxamine 5'-phosphate oxidase [Bacteroidales bacterium]|nr:pyridoxamine 5'-phosphate oxidase [Bacteroidales bacterium]
MNLSDLRRDFGQQNERLIWPENPFPLFEKWLNDAIEKPVQEANALILSTVGKDLKPSSRVVLLKEFSEAEGFVFYTDYNSHKGQDLKNNPYAAIIFYWNLLERQIRIEGKVGKISRKRSKAYFNSRPLESRLSAYVSPQSQPIESLENLQQLREDLINSEQEITCPEHWGGYALFPSKIEFWQGGANRLHHRMEYTQTGDKWMKQMLAP